MIHVTSIKFNRFLKLIFPETSHFRLVTKPKHAKSGLCSRIIDLRKQLNLIDFGVKIESCDSGKSPGRHNGVGRLQVQGYLAHKKPSTPKTLQYAYA